MPEQSYAIRQDVFGLLAKLKKGPMEVWWLLVRLMECDEPWSVLPSKLWPDARALVAAGIVLEDEAHKGRFQVNPEVAYISTEPTIREVIDEAHP